VARFFIEQRQDNQLKVLGAQHPRRAKSLCRPHESAEAPQESRPAMAAAAVMMSSFKIPIGFHIF
jgi:hypothetical protein